MIKERFHRVVPFSIPLSCHWWQTIETMQDRRKKGWTDSWQRTPVFLALWVHPIPRCLSNQGKHWADRKPYGVNSGVWRLLRRRITRDLTAVPEWLYICLLRVLALCGKIFFSLYLLLTNSTQGENAAALWKKLLQQKVFYAKVLRAWL